MQGGPGRERSYLQRVMVRFPLAHLCRGFTRKCFGLCTQGHHWFKLISSHGEKVTATDGVEGGQQSPTEGFWISRRNSIS